MDCIERVGLQPMQEASQILERLDDAVGQARFSADLGATTRAIDLFPEQGQEFRVCGIS